MSVLATGELLLCSPDGGWDRARWEQLPDDGNRYEVIDGVLYMATSPSLFHEWVVRTTSRALYSQIDDQQLGWTWTSRAGVFMPGCDPVQPDIAVVLHTQRDIMHDGRIYGVPALIAEVLSPSHPELDTRIKRGAYARAGLPEYWLVRPGSRDVLVCSQPDASLSDFTRTELVPADGELRAHTLPVRLLVADLFAGAPDLTL
ncbi:MAG TPA: Uma2 family endonuclease [Chloroflexota bacterium]|jgi:Uma2 family endonuclease|nr:Uma2 family endonuclease [Chloroflexota bacterium]